MTYFSLSIDPLSTVDIVVGVGFSLAKRLLFIFFLSILYIKNLRISYDMKNVDRRWIWNFHQSNTSLIRVVEIWKMLDQLQPKQVIFSSSKN